MRVNVYAEEMTDRIEIIGKEIDGRTFTGLRFYLELPATVNGQHYQGPFIHRPGDDDSGAVTFWGKRDLRAVLRKALAALDEHYAKQEGEMTESEACEVCEHRPCVSFTDDNRQDCYRVGYERLHDEERSAQPQETKL